MTHINKAQKHRRSVIFQKRNISEDKSSSTSSSKSKNLQCGKHHKKPQKASSTLQASSAKRARASMIPDVFTSSPCIVDTLRTQSSEIQGDTIQACLPFLSGAADFLEYNDQGVPHLRREAHISFLQKHLADLPSGYTGSDASRPWMLYWSLAALSILGEDVSPYRERLIATVTAMQNVTGGFGGGHGQMSHLAGSYAAVLSLCIIGGSEAFEVIDLEAMRSWLGQLKQPDGGFQMVLGGEVDVRGAYCATTIISLLNLPLELSKDSPAWTGEGSTLLSNLPEWIASCQTFEGGMAHRPDAEAHGGYAFCSLACLSILGDPHVIIPEHLDIYSHISWLSARQYGPEGGYSGRTNKLVDGCYSHWVGGCWPLVEAVLEGPRGPSPNSSVSPEVVYSREGLIRYALACCQDTTNRGGLRDKPGHNPDPYHTLYVLAGLGSAQHKWSFNLSSAFSNLSLSSAQPSPSPAKGNSLTSAYHWTSEPVHDESQVYDDNDRVKPLHPVFVVPVDKAVQMRAHFAR